MKQAQIQEYYKQPEHSGPAYVGRRFSSPGGAAVSGLELLPFDQWIHLKPGQRLLDVASGTGRVLSTLPKTQLEQVTALDSSRTMLDHLRKGFEGVDTVSADIFAYDSPHPFTVITALRFFDHFDLTDQRKLLKQFTHLLAPGGSIVLSFLVRPSLESAVNSMIKVGQMNFFNRRREYEQMFTDCGLKVKRTYQCFVLPRGSYYRLPRPLVSPAIYIERAMSRLLPGLCSYQACELQRPS